MDEIEKNLDFSFLRLYNRQVIVTERQYHIRHL